MIKTLHETSKTLEDLSYVRFPIKMLDLDWVSNADAVIYAFMLNRFTFFKGIGKGYFENIKDIALGSRQDESTVKRTLKKLSEHGYIQINKVKVMVGVSNNYVVLDVHSVLSAPEVKQANHSLNKVVNRSNALDKQDEDDYPW